VNSSLSSKSPPSHGVPYGPSINASHLNRLSSSGVALIPPSD